CQQHNTSPFTS
nr:immunoglobulin light chain junction region [Macaca mulatta]